MDIAILQLFSGILDPRVKGRCYYKLENILFISLCTLISNGEDYEDRAEPLTLNELFTNVRKNYFRLYSHYLYFNVVRYSYIYMGQFVPLIILAPSIVAGAFTLGIMQRILSAFNQVENSFQFLVSSWTTIVELLSIYKRLKAFEAIINNQPLPEEDSHYLETHIPPSE